MSNSIRALFNQMAPAISQGFANAARNGQSSFTIAHGNPSLVDDEELQNIFEELFDQRFSGDYDFDYNTDNTITFYVSSDNSD